MVKVVTDLRGRRWVVRRPFSPWRPVSHPMHSNDHGPYPIRQPTPPLPAPTEDGAVAPSNAWKASFLTLNVRKASFLACPRRA